MENHIDGLVMDTTWNVMNQYVTAILMGIPMSILEMISLGIKEFSKKRQ
jgi:hypothetical protein